MFFSLSIFASIKARSNKILASSFSSLMNFRGDGQTRGSADEGFNNAAQAPRLCLKATEYGILLQDVHNIQKQGLLYPN